MIDLTGKLIGKWIVLEQTTNNRHNQRRWLCRCDCGAVKPVLGRDLRSGQSKSCGHKGPRLDLIGQVFGEWTVVQPTVIDHVGRAMWSCRCSCGVEKNVLGSNLTRGGTKSCGHARGGGFIQNGYRILYKPNHPNAFAGGKVFEHTVVMSEMLGRPLSPKETVHHKNLQRDDNRPDNLELWYSQPKGARVADLIDYVAKYHSEAVEKRISELTTAGNLYRSETGQVDLASAK